MLKQINKSEVTIRFELAPWMLTMVINLQWDNDEISGTFSGAPKKNYCLLRIEFLSENLLNND